MISCLCRDTAPVGRACRYPDFLSCVAPGGLWAAGAPCSSRFPFRFPGSILRDGIGYMCDSAQPKVNDWGIPLFLL
jgi:hypothetical protein